MAEAIPINDTIPVTGGGGFIGANFVLSLIEETGVSAVNLDLLTLCRQSGQTLRRHANTLRPQRSYTNSRP
jgi:dTDP-D-glucose 4,6-dehydratase